MKIILPWPPKELNPNSRKHWAAKAKAVSAYREVCYWETISQIIKPNKHIKHIIYWEGTIHFIALFSPPDRRRRDDDNIFASFKAGRDGIAEALGVDDNRFMMHPMVCKPIKGGNVIVTLCSDTNFNEILTDITERTMG